MNDGEDALLGRLDALSEILGEAKERCAQMSGALGQADRELEAIGQAAGLMELAASGLADIRTPTPDSYARLADAAFEEPTAALDAARSVLETRFYPVAAMQDVEQASVQALEALRAHGNEAAAEATAKFDEITAMATDELGDLVEMATSGWTQMAEAAESAVSGMEQEFSDLRSGAIETLEAELEEKLAAALGESFSEMATRIDNLFDDAERMMTEAENVLSDGVGNVVDAIGPVIEIQRAIADLRPAMEILI